MMYHKKQKQIPYIRITGYGNYYQHYGDCDVMLVTPFVADGYWENGKIKYWQLKGEDEKNIGILSDFIGARPAQYYGELETEEELKNALKKAFSRRKITHIEFPRAFNDHYGRPEIINIK